MKTRLLLLLLSFTALHCKKDNGGNTTVTDRPSVINITKPATGTIYLNGTPLVIEGEMTDLNVLATARVEIRNKTTNAVLFQQSNPTTNVTFYRFQWSWTVSGISGPVPVTVKVTAIDKLAKEVSKEVDAMLDN